MAIYFEAESNRPTGYVVTETVGNAVASGIMMVGMRLSKRYREYVVGGWEEAVREGKGLDKWDKLVFGSLPRRQQNWVSIRLQKAQRRNGN